MNRQATAGQLSASIAHELNQPLGAILNNAEAAALIIDSPSPDLEEVKTIIGDIKRDDQRAARSSSACGASSRGVSSTRRRWTSMKSSAKCSRSYPRRPPPAT